MSEITQHSYVGWHSNGYGVILSSMESSWTMVSYIIIEFEM